jgi:ABC-2 type transport system permease protein
VAERVPFNQSAAIKGGRLIAILRALVRLSATEELQYPANFFASAIGTLFWLSMAVLTVLVFYEHTSHLGGWTFWETVVLLGVFNALVGVIEGWLRPGLGSLAHEIRQGTLDLMLVRPVDPQLYVSFRALDLWRVADVILGFALSWYGMYRLGRPVAPHQIVGFLITFFSSVAVLYSLWLCLMCMSFWFVAVENVSTVFDALFEAARYPASAYPSALRIVFVYLLPVAWSTTMPASALTGRLSPESWFAAIAVAAGSLLVSRLVWLAALKRYTSAGG